MEQQSFRFPVRRFGVTTYKKTSCAVHLPSCLFTERSSRWSMWECWLTSLGPVCHSLSVWEQYYRPLPCLPLHLLLPRLLLPAPAASTALPANSRNRMGSWGQGHLPASCSIDYNHPLLPSDGRIGWVSQSSITRGPVHHSLYYFPNTLFSLVN